MDGRTDGRTEDHFNVGSCIGFGNISRGSDRDNTIFECRGVSSWVGENYVVSFVIPGSVISDVSFELFLVSDENTQFLVSDELIQKGLGAYETSNCPTVGNIDTHDDGERPQHVGAYELQQSKSSLSSSTTTSHHFLHHQIELHVQLVKGSAF